MAKFEGMTNAQMMKNLGAHASSVLRSAFLPIAFGRSRRRQHARAYATFIRASCFIRHSSFACHAIAQRRRVLRHLRSQTSLILHWQSVHV